MPASAGRKSAVIATACTAIGVIPLASAAETAGAAESSAAGRAVPVRTLVTTSSEIDAFAQDGRDIAWITRGGRCGYRLHIRTAAGRSVSINGIACTDNPDQSDLVRGELALADRRVLWNVLHHWSNSQEGYLIRTASVADRRIRTLPCCDMYGGLEGGGASLPLAGSGGMLVYYSHRDYDDGDGVTERTVRRLVRTESRRLFDVDRPLDLAVDRGRVALVRRELGRTLGQVRSQRGATVATYTSAGHPLAVAMSGSVAAALTRFGTGRKQIELFDAGSGAARGAVGVPPATAGSLAASERVVAFTVGRTIRGIDVRTRASRLLARTEGTPLGLSISGGRLAWSESARGRGWIRVLSLPR